MNWGSFLAVAAVGIALSVAAGRAQGLEEEDGVFLGDMWRLLFWCVPLRRTAGRAGKVFAVVGLWVLAGGAAVPVFAGMGAVQQLDSLARALAEKLPNPQED